MKIIKISDVLFNKCYFKGCKYNDDGCCLNTDILYTIIILIEENARQNNDEVIFKDVEFECEHMKVLNNCCPFCGDEYVIRREKYPYSDTYAIYEYKACKNCD